MAKSSQELDRRALLDDALQALERMQKNLDASEASKREPIAVIGMGCRWPGEANDPESFWSLLREGKDGICEVPPERWDIDEYYDADPNAAGKMYTRRAGFISEVDQFDAKFFGISPREAESLDPQQRLILETSWEALERAGQDPTQLKRSRTGVFVGIGSTDYAQLGMTAYGLQNLDAYVGSGGGNSFAAGRLSYTLGLQGPAMAVDTTCSSSLVAIHLACQSLRAGDCDMALASGVSLMLSPYLFVYLSRTSALSADGHSKVFDARADGFGRGEGCGVVVLKRLSDATRSKDNILAVIQGSAVNQDGASSGLTVPNGTAQALVIREALKNAGVKPHQISFVETHGTGTSLGDPIELGALTKVLGEGRSKDTELIVGAVKANIGHTEAAAGIAGLMKAVLCLQHRKIPGQLHFKNMNPKADTHNVALRVPTELTAWTSQNGPRYAGVSAFGLSGTNAHVILTEAPEQSLVHDGPERPSCLLPLSAKSYESLRELAARYGEHLSSTPETPIADVCFSAGTGRPHFNHRLAIRADTGPDLAADLAAFASGNQPESIVAARVDETRRTRIAFLFTGQGSQYAGMGQQLYQTQPTYRRTMDKCAEILEPVLEHGLLSVLFGDQQVLLDQTAYTQPALFSVEYSLAELWRSWGVIPSIVLGHSVGEYVAACVAGVMSLSDGLRLVAERGRLMQELPAGGTMAAVFVNEKTTLGYIKDCQDQVSIAAINGPENTVIAGAGKTIRSILKQLDDDGIEAQELTVSHAFHSPLMDPVLDRFNNEARKIDFAKLRINLISNVSGELMTSADILDTEYWTRHIRQPVRFERSMRTLAGQGSIFVLEIGPQPTLTAMGQACIPAADLEWGASLRKGTDDWHTLLDSVASLYVNGANIDWAGFDRDYSRSRRVLPTYPFERQRYWLADVDTHPRQTPITDHYDSDKPLIGRHISLGGDPATHIWERRLTLADVPYMADHKVQGVSVLPATGYLEMVIEAATDVFGETAVSLSDVQIHRAIVLRENVAPILQVQIRDSGNEAASFRIYSRRTDANHVPSAWTLHVTGKLRKLDRDPGHITPAEIDSIKNRCSKTITGDEFYKLQAAKGNQWGPCFQGIQTLWIGQREAFSEVQAAAGIAGHVKNYRFHPALADSSGQLLAATISMEESDDATGGAFVGEGIEEIHFYRQPQSGRLYSHAKLRTESDSDKNVIIGNVRIFDEDGALVCENEGVRFRYLSAEEQRTELMGFDDWIYELTWKPSRREKQREGITEETGLWLILADHYGVGETLAAELKAAGQSTVIAFAGDAFTQTGEDQFIVRSGHAGDLRRLADALVTGKHGLRGVVHLWSLDTKSDPGIRDADLKRGLTASGISIQAMLHSLVRINASPAPKFWLVTMAAQHLPDIDVLPPAPLQAAAWGLGRTIAMEHSELWGGLIDLDPQAALDDAATSVAGELLQPDANDQIAFRGPDRFVARLSRAKLTSKQEFKLLPDASYLISGGFGGLGLAAARRLVEGGAKHIILLGRTALPPRESWNDLEPGSTLHDRVSAISDLEARGANVHTLIVDVADFDALKAALRSLDENKVPETRGVIHAAGIMQYESLMDHDAARMEEIFRPKAFGAWQLHRLFADAALDFFVMYSSASSVLSSPFIGSYAAANAVLDCLAHYRRSLGQSALSINWGIWTETGVATKFDGARDNAPEGTGGLTTKQGLDALFSLLGSDATQTAVIPIDWAAWQNHYAAFASSPYLEYFLDASNVESDAPTLGLDREQLLAADLEERPRILMAFLRAQAERILKFGERELDVNQPLGNLGLDSLMAVELRNRVESAIGVALAMVQYVEGPSVSELTNTILDALCKGDESHIPMEASASANGTQWEVGEI